MLMCMRRCGWLVSLLCAGCGGISFSATYSSDNSRQIPYQEVSPVIANSAISQARFVVIRDVVSWDALWKQHTANISPQPPTPAINFSQNMVAGIFLGSRSNGCYGVAAESVFQHDDPEHIDVTFRELVPTADMICAAVITNPATLIVLPYSILPVEFIRAP
jgi:hypothetical protein